jgi:hypothetical protein
MSYTPCDSPGSNRRNMNPDLADAAVAAGKREYASNVLTTDSSINFPGVDCIFEGLHANVREAKRRMCCC